MDGNNRSTALLVVVVVFLLIMCRCCLADFAEVPSSVTINMSEDQNALFRCRHEQVDAVISWLINGISSSRYRDVDPYFIQESNGTIVDTLTIPAIPVYNGTEVVCVAIVTNGSPEETSPVMLTITVSDSITTNPPSLTPTTTTDSKLTPTTATFEISPSPLTVAVEQKVAVFVCQHLSCDVLTWLVNGAPLGRINPPNITTSSSGAIHLLSIGTVLEYSGTTVECVATFSDGLQNLSAPTVTLLIQDTPAEVENATCERNSSSSLLTTRWSPLPSLDLNDTDPDIVYSVELYKITCGEDIFMSREDVFVNSTNNTVDPMQIYKVIITARNNVEGARNGNSTEMREKFMTLNKARLFQLTQNSLNTRVDTPVPSYYTMILEPLDGHQKQNLMINISVERSGEMVNMSVDGEIPTKTLWNASLLAYGCQSDTVVKGAELSTHDFQNISVTSPQPGEVRVTGDFIDGSTATGLLTIVISTSEIFYHLIERGSDQLDIEGSIQGVVGGEQSISFFVVEESGLPFNRTASTPKVVSVENGLEVDNHSSSFEYSLQSTSTGVCITCTFLDSYATDCVAVVHQRISQLSSSGLMNIESSHKLTRSNDTASGCIEGVNMEDYQVGVFEWRQAPSIKDTEVTGSGSVSSCQGCIVGAVLGVLVFILLAVVAVVVVSLFVVRRTKLPLHVHGEDIVRSVPPTPPFPNYVNQPENEATVNNHYESITVPNHQGSRAGLDESDDEASEPLLSTPSPSPPLPTRQAENSFYSDSSSDSPPSSQDTFETDLSSPSVSNDDRISVDPVPLYDQPQLPGSTVVLPPTDIQHQSNEEKSPPPVPLWTEDSKILIQEPSPGYEDTTLTDIQSPSDPTYAEPQMTGRAPVQTPPTNGRALQSPPPVPPRTEDREVLLQGSSESSRTQGSPHIAVLIDLPPPPDPTYAEPQLPAVKQPPSKEKQVYPSGESCGPTYAQPVLSTASGVTSPPPATEPVVYEDVKGFKNSEGQQYAMLVDLNTSKKVCTPDDSDQKKTEYSVIQPHSLIPTTTAVSVGPDTNSQKNKPTTETDPPFTVEYIFPTLLSMASKWQAVGEALSLDEDRLDEIFTNNDTDEACLRVMLEFYMKRSDLKHSWEEIREARRKVEEKDGGTEELGPTVPEKEHFLDPPLCQSTTSCIVPSPVMKKKRNVFSSGRIASRDLPLSQTDKYSNGDEVISENGENYSAQCNTMVPPPIPPHRPTDVCTISKDVCDVSSTGHDQPTEISTVEIPSNCGKTDEIHDKQVQTSEEVDVNKQTNKQAGDEDVDAYDVQTVSRCGGQENIKIRETSHDEDDDNDIFTSAQHVPCEEENADDHVLYKPCIDDQAQHSIDSNGVKIHTEDPSRTSSYEVFPLIDCALAFPPQLFHGIFEENQVVEHHQPVCQAQTCDLDYLCDEQSSEHGYIDASVLPTHVDTYLEHMSQPYFDHNDQNEECYCQESEVDKTDYETALRKQLNIGGASIPREREELERGDLPDLCQSSKKSTRSNLGKLSTQNKAGDSAPSNLSYLSKQATAIQHIICTKKQMNGKNKLRDILHNDHDHAFCTMIMIMVHVALLYLHINKCTIKKEHNVKVFY